MRAVLQRVTHGSVSVDGAEIASIGKGLVILVGIGPADALEGVRKMAEKTALLRIFEDEAGMMNLSLLDVGGEALVISQFTLYADTSRGRRPSFIGSAPPQQASPLVDAYAQRLAEYGLTVKQGIFGAEMLVVIHNDGPVTIVLENDG